MVSVVPFLIVFLSVDLLSFSSPLFVDSSSLLSSFFPFHFGLLSGVPFGLPFGLLVGVGFGFRMDD